VLHCVRVWGGSATCNGACMCSSLTVCDMCVMLFVVVTPPFCLVCSYSYDGDATCAADGMCQEKCPVKINTGESNTTHTQETST